MKANQDNSTIENKIFTGYQGWFRCQGDHSPKNVWDHWSKSVPSPKTLTFEAYPDVREYPQNCLFQPEFAPFGNSQPAKLFSSYPKETIDLHFKWMQEYGIDGVGMQRFAVNTRCSTPAFKTSKDILKNARAAAEETGRLFYIMYDISGFSSDELVDSLKRDWEQVMVGELNITDSPSYAMEKGRYVVCIWGIGIREGTPQGYQEIIKWFKEQNCYVIGGTPRQWRTHNEDMMPAYKALDMVSPWMVGCYSNREEIDISVTEHLIPDFEFCNHNKIAYQPVFFPGFSWANWKEGKRNLIPRDNGEFMWRQIYHIVKNKIKSAYIAMFDEYDEATNIAKMAEDSTMIPTDQYFLTTCADGKYISSDFYLRLAGCATKMLRGEIPLTEEIPIPLSNGPVYFRTGFEEGTDAKLTWENRVYEDRVRDMEDFTLKCESNPMCIFGKSSVRLEGKALSPNAFVQFQAIELDIPVKDRLTLEYSILATTQSGKNVYVGLVADDNSEFNQITQVNQVDKWESIKLEIPISMRGKRLKYLLISYKSQGETGIVSAFIDDVVISI